jgi:hypothetical protein
MEFKVSPIHLSPERIAMGILGGFIYEIAQKQKKTSEEVAENLVEAFIKSALVAPIQTQLAIDELEEELDKIAISVLEEMADDVREEEVN